MTALYNELVTALAITDPPVTMFAVLRYCYGNGPASRAQRVVFTSNYRLTSFCIAGKKIVPIFYSES